MSRFEVTLADVLIAITDIAGLVAFGAICYALLWVCQ